VNKMATSPVTYRSSGIKSDDVSLAMENIFSQPDVYSLDIADGLKQFLCERKYDLNLLLRSDAASIAEELGIEQYVAKLIIDAAKKTATK
jgi:hypothetical protein